MFTDTIHLNEHYGFLANNTADPTLSIIAQDTNTERKRPAIIVCPGGGYYGLADHEGEPVALEYLADGVQTFVLKYSVSPNRFPQQILEVACTVDYIVKNAEKFSIDIDKIAITGFSAGGHLAASYCTLLKDEAITKHIDARPVNAAILCYPVITAYGNTHQGSFKCLTGHHELTEQDREHFSLEKHVNELTPPTFIFHTSDDMAVNVNNSLYYMKALNDNGIPFEAHIFPHGRHGLSTATTNTILNGRDSNIDHDSDWIIAARKWLKLTLNY